MALRAVLTVAAGKTGPAPRQTPAVWPTPWRRTVPLRVAAQANPPGPAAATRYARTAVHAINVASSAAPTVASFARAQPQAEALSLTSALATAPTSANARREQSASPTRVARTFATRPAAPTAIAPAILAAPRTSCTLETRRCPGPTSVRRPSRPATLRALPRAARRPTGSIVFLWPV